MDTAQPNLGSRTQARLRGIHGVAVLNGLWGLIVPLSAAQFYGWLKYSALSLGEAAIHGMDWTLWLLPLGLVLAGWTILGLYLRNQSARWLSLALASVAVIVYAAHLVAALVAPERFSALPSLAMITLYCWPLWYLSRPRVRRAFEE